MTATTPSERWSDTSVINLGHNFPFLLSTDMNCIDFPCVNYSRLIVFGKKRGNETHGKISHSTVTNAWAHINTQVPPPPPPPPPPGLNPSVLAFVRFKGIGEIELFSATHFLYKFLNEAGGSIRVVILTDFLMNRKLKSLQSPTSSCIMEPLL